MRVIGGGLGEQLRVWAQENSPIRGLGDDPWGPFQGTLRILRVFNWGYSGGKCYDFSERVSHGLGLQCHAMQ